MNLLAIDFGNDSVKAAMYKSSIEATHDYERVFRLVLSEAEGDKLPSIVNIFSDRTEVGRANGQTEDVVYQIKKHFSDAKDTEFPRFITTRNKNMEVVEVLKESYAFLVDTCRKAGHVENEELEVIITVPVSFSELQRYQLKMIFDTIPGVHLRPIITEPFAGLFSCDEFIELLTYSDQELDQALRAFNLLVFDIGAGTLDMSIFEVSFARGRKRPGITTLVSRGLPLAGNDLTQLLFEACLDDPNSHLGDIIKRMRTDKLNRIMKYVAKDSPEYSKNLERIQRDIHQSIMSDFERIKMAVCNRAHSPADSFDCGNVIPGLRYSITYQQFTEMLDAHFRKKLTAAIDIMIQQSPATVSGDQIQKVLIIGGTGQIPYFQEILRNHAALKGAAFLSPKKIDRFNAVAYGAAIFGSLQNRFDIFDRSSYEIGVMEDGIYRRLRSVYAWSRSAPTRPVLVKAAEEEGKPVINVVQLFDDTTRHPELRFTDQLIPIGYFSLESIYPACIPGESYFISIYYQDDVLKARVSMTPLISEDDLRDPSNGIPLSYHMKPLS